MTLLIPSLLFCHKRTKIVRQRVEASNCLSVGRHRHLFLCWSPFRRGYLFLEALVAMMIVSVVLGGTLTALSTAGAVSQEKKRQLVRIMLCEDVIENIRHQWTSSPDPVALLHVAVDIDEELPEPMKSLGWRDTCIRCPWPPAIQSAYTGRYRIQPVLRDRFEQEIDPVRPGTLFRLDVRVSSSDQGDEDTSLVTFLPVPGPLEAEEPFSP